MLTSQELCEAVNRWSSLSIFRIRDLGERIAIQEILHRPCHTIRLTGQYESRSIASVHVPYSGGPIDHNGEPPELWDLDVTAPAEFADRTEQIPVPHTESVEKCRPCTGSGTVRCTSCHGSGRSICTSCGGSGSQMKTHTRTTHDAFGNPNTTTETVSESCTWCMGSGHATCTWCHGRGHVTCTTCAGHGRVKAFQQATVKFHVVKAEEVVGSADLPEALALGAAGAVRCDETMPRIESVAPIAADVDPLALEMLQQSWTKKPDTRLLFQNLTIEEVPVYEATYTFRGSNVRRLWIYGTDRLVHAPDAPWRWWLALLLVFGGVSAAAGLIFGAIQVFYG